MFSLSRSGRSTPSKLLQHKSLRNEHELLKLPFVDDLALFVPQIMQASVGNYNGNWAHGPQAENKLKPSSG
jgi:hypothetical protein